MVRLTGTGPRDGHTSSTPSNVKGDTSHGTHTNTKINNHSKLVLESTERLCLLLFPVTSFVK